MKKIYTLLVALLVTSFTFGQTVNGSFENWTTGALDSWDIIDFNTTDLTQNTNATYVTDGTSSASINLTTQDQGVTDMRQNISTLTDGATYTVSLDVYATDNQARVRMFGPGWSPSIYSDETLLNQWQTITFDYTHTSGTVEFGIRLYDLTANWLGTGSQFYIDNFNFVEHVAPSITITAPVDGSTLTSGNVNVSVAVNNFVVANPGGGDGHIHWTVDAAAQPMKYETLDEALVGLAAGPHTIYMELVDDSHTPIVPATNHTINFTVSIPTLVADIATLRAGTPGNFYTLTGEALLTYQQSFRGQKFIEDATGGILIDDSAGNITTVYTIADGITGITGELGGFGGMMQFIPSGDPGIASSTGNTLTPQSVTLAMLTASPEMFESELVEVTGVLMDNTIPNFTGGAEHNMAQGGDNFLFRSTFYSADYASDGAAVPTVPANIVGIVNERTGSLYYLTARDAADFSVVLSVSNFDEIAGFNLYPNPASGNQITIATTANAAKNVEVFNILGKRVIKATVENTLDVTNLQSGVYIVKVTENGLTATKKLVIR